METIMAAIAGAIFNVYRGGVFTNRDKIVARIKPEWLRKIINFLVQGDTVNALAFALFCVITHCTYIKGMEGGVPVYMFLPGALALFLAAFVMMMRGATPAWGEYIGAAGGWRPTADKPLGKEVHYIDKIIEPLRGRPRLWGMVGLSLRCGEWGLFIGMPLVGFIGIGAFLPLLAGLTAGPVVFLLSKLLPHKYVWKAFEAVLGMLLWVSCL